jgi:hypothetical protein
MFNGQFAMTKSQIPNDKSQVKNPAHKGGALKPQSFKTKNEIPKQVRDDKKESQPGCHAELVSASG